MGRGRSIFPQDSFPSLQLSGRIWYVGQSQQPQASLTPQVRPQKAMGLVQATHLLSEASTSALAKLMPGIRAPFVFLFVFLSIFEMGLSTLPRLVSNSWAQAIFLS